MFACFIASAWMISLSLLSAHVYFHVNLRLCVEGEYRSTHADHCFHGHYRCILNARAVLERDNGDYILYSLEKYDGNITEVVWKEWLDLPGKERGYSLSDLVHPEIKMRFALREKGKVLLDFLVEADVSTPGLKRLKQKFFWPRSFTAAGGDEEENYKQGIFRGSNRVEWQESAMKKPSGVVGECSWSWKDVRKQWTHTQRIDLSFSAAPERGETR